MLGRQDDHGPTIEPGGGAQGVLQIGESGVDVVEGSGKDRAGGDAPRLLPTDRRSSSVKDQPSSSSSAYHT